MTATSARPCRRHGHHRLEGSARLDLVSRPAVRWRSTGSSWVDTGLACFMSSGSATAFGVVLDESAAASPDGDYPADALGACMAASIPAERRGDEFASGKWGRYLTDDDRVMAVFAAGLGDGSYDVLEGVDAGGQVAALALDFGAIPDF